MKVTGTTEWWVAFDGGQEGVPHPLYYASAANGMPDVTLWQYDIASGLLTNKQYADGMGTAYSYTPNGQLATRTWARGVTTSYSYDFFGALTNIHYSDDTPDVSFAYDRLGRQVGISDGTGMRGFAYDASLQLVQETNATAEINRTYDELGRPQMVDLGMFNVNYGYDAYGRFAAVTSTVLGVFHHRTEHLYSYLEDSELLASILSGNLLTTFSYEPHRDVKVAVDHVWDGDPISRFAYSYDAVGRRTARVDSDAITNEFGYNLRSELIAALMGTNSYGYSYDAIGNRTVYTNNTSVTTYVANELNQYTNILPAAIQPVYDSDGNMTYDGKWGYVWDAENRLVAALPVVPNQGLVRLRFAYDYMGRRVEKEVETWTGMEWSNVVTIAFTYDGWNMIRETRSDESKPNYYVWGLDLSGTLQGAGGVGGLLARVRQGNIPDPLYYASDANGNVTDVLNNNGALAAHYEYDPFGNTIAQSGVLAEANPFRFSSKYWDSETGIYYYGFRYYDAPTGRWLSPDPLGDQAFYRLYVRGKSARQQRELKRSALIPPYLFVLKQSSHLH
ncbi:MAG: RHS repeat-associated core domain-containing protein [Kiritimatiellae bacterium]|nr:RHS repeat-associated core domain-containing protein [Kiritimatiellia bacterium]